MKKIVLISLLGLLVACNGNMAISEKDIKSEGNGTIANSVANNNPAEATVIDPSECYLIQESNELGEPVDSYICMTFYQKAGSTYEEAYESVKSDLDGLVQRMVADERNGSNYDANRWELRPVVRNVQNSPNENLVYTSIELYMYSYVYKAYILHHELMVIDSEGNIYYRADLPD